MVITHYRFSRVRFVLTCCVAALLFSSPFAHASLLDQFTHLLYRTDGVAIQYRLEDWHYWTDEDRDCVNTRDNVLINTSLSPVSMSPDGCHVTQGKWLDPYTARSYYTPEHLIIDQVVSLEWAHHHGGAGWNAAQKSAFANDRTNLVAIHSGITFPKHGHGPDQWLPPNRYYHCQYLAIWNRVLKKYSRLEMPAAEQHVFDQQRAKCTR